MCIPEEHVGFDPGDPEAPTLAGRSHVGIAQISCIDDV
jgi:hypothetical protein